jgi:GNAT superfamily N-acetyltransferase
MDISIQVYPALTRRDLMAFVSLPWRIYREDPNWVPPLISDQLHRLDPGRGPFFIHAEGQLFLARQGRRDVGRILVFIDHRRVAHLNRQVGGFGFFEAIQDYAVAEALLDAAIEWLWDRDISELRGPTSFADYEYPGVLIDGAAVPPVLLTAHTMPYYGDFLKGYGMEKDYDLYAWRASREQVDAKLEKILPELTHSAQAAAAETPLTVRAARLDAWDSEIRAAHDIFKSGPAVFPESAPISYEEFQSLAHQMRTFLDPSLALFGEVADRPIGFCVALPDFNQVLMQLNGRLFPKGWIAAQQMIEQIDTLSLKVMRIQEEYRQQGIDMLLFLEALKACRARSFSWLDCSVTSENDPLIELIAGQLGAEQYKHYRVFRLDL